MTTERFNLILSVSLFVLFVGCQRHSTNPPTTNTNRPQHVVLSGIYQHAAIANDTIAYHALVTYANGDTVGDSVQVRWSRFGRGTWRSAATYTHSGTATNVYTLGSGVGVDTLRVSVTSGSDTVTGILTLALVAGVPNRVHFINSNNFSFLSNSPTEVIAVVILDTAFNVILHPQLSWNCNLGSIIAAGTSWHGDTSYAWLSASNRVGYGELWVAMNGGLSDTLNYHAYTNELPDITLSGPPSHTAIPTDTVRFTATANIFGNLYTDSIRFQTDCYNVSGGAGIGHWVVPSVWTTTDSTAIKFVMGQGVGTDSLVVTEIVPNNGSAWASMPFAHVAGVPHYTNLFPSGLQMHPQNMIQVCAVFKDSLNNRCVNIPTTWGCTPGMGTIVSTGFSAQGDTAFANLTAGTQLGSLRFWVSSPHTPFTDTANATILSSTPRSIALSSDTPILQVRGTYGVEETMIRAIVRDENGNPITNATRVFLRITNASQFLDTTGVVSEPSFNLPGTDTITTVTNNVGEAIAALSSGIKTGAVQLAAWVLDSNGVPTNISATLTNMQIVAGPPNRISASYNANNGSQVGDSTWSIWVNATIRDRYSNPVANQTNVTVSVNPVTLAQLDQNLVQTGNTGPNSIHLPGVAFTTLSYNGINSFDTVVVHAVCIGRDTSNNPVSVHDSLRLALPLQQGVIQLHVTPMTFTFTRMPRVDFVTHTVWVTVTDGYGTLVHGAPILFSVQRGRIFKTLTEAQNRLYYPPLMGGQQAIPGTNPSIYWPVNKRKTGNYTVPWYPALNWTDPNGNGSATVYIGAVGPSTMTVPPIGDIFLTPTQMAATSDVTASMEGYPSVQQVTVTINYSRN